MDFTKINSLDSLYKRKRKIAKEIKYCEDSISDSFQNIVTPFEEILRPDNSIEEDDFITEMECYSQPKFMYNIMKGVKNGKRLVQMFKLGKAIFYDYKK